MTTKRREALLELGRALAPGARTLAVEVGLACDDAPAYAKRYARRIADYLDDDLARSPSLPWFALIEALVAARACATLDWKDDYAELAGKVGALRAAPRDAFAWARDDAELPERSTWELLELTARHLRTRGLQLANLDSNSDRYCLVLAPLSDGKRLAKLADTAGFGSLEPFGDELAAATRDRLARQKKLERERARAHARERRRPVPATSSYRRGEEVRTIGSDKSGYSYFVASPTVRRSISHTFDVAATARRALEAEIDSWLADGFRRLSDEESAALPERGLWDVLCVAELPDGARYFVDGRKAVRAIDLRGDTIWSTSGLIGRQFGHIQTYRHCASPESAQRIFARELKQSGDEWEPIARAALAKAIGAIRVNSD